MNGRVVKTIFQKELVSQEHHVKIDVNDLQAGNYFYVVEKPSGSVKGRFQKIAI
jgi:hypothetical protein